ncbi:branched-chain amino acid ABC transporter permease [Salinactinospora qingdaonensis]|uniref:Branched-chain amino acid transport system permease protein n=1 Tax=Salinactinospora qingdaonensis TaxID=702744 RepID=A0ABP7FNN7_9ACTN
MRRRLVTVLLAVLAGTLAPSAVAVADTQGGETLHGEIRIPEAVEGIELTVYREDAEIGAATTDAEGKWEVALPGPGEYRVVLDQGSVPEEFAVADPPGHELTGLPVDPGEEQLAIFRLVEAGQQNQSPSDSATAPTTAAGSPTATGSESDDPDTAAGSQGGAQTSFGTTFLQLALEGVIYGLIIAISSVGLSLIFGTTRMINFANGEMVTFGAMMALLFSTIGIFDSIPLVAATVVAVVLGAGLGAGLDRFIWRPLRRRNVALIQMFIVSIGLSLLLRHLFLVIFGADRQTYDEYELQDSLTLGALAITPRDLTLVLLAILVLVGVGLMLQFTRIGKAMRAVSDNRDLAESSGIDVERVTLYVWTLGGALAALGGVFAGLNQIVHWQMGFHLLLLMFAAVILGGLGTAYGAMAGGLVIGLVAQLSTLWFPPQLMNVWALAIMILVLLLRPQGIFGRRERVG